MPSEPGKTGQCLPKASTVGSGAVNKGLIGSIGAAPSTTNSASRASRSRRLSLSIFLCCADQATCEIRQISCAFR
jgi:hypothetical protein